MSNDKKKWDLVDSVINKDQKADQMEITESVSLKKDVINAEPEGILAQYRANKIKQDTALKMMKEYHHAQLEVSKHQFMKAVELKKRLTDIDANKILEEMNQKYFSFMKQLGLKNVKERMELLIQLNRQSSELLEQTDSEDWPEQMKRKTIEQIFQLQERFENKIMRED